MKIVLTNDDGIDAPGLQALAECLQGLGRIIIVAPAEPQSGVAHKVTTRSPIRVNRIQPKRFSVEGTPADCVRIALKKIASDADWLIAGINPGANLGSDVYQSGTVAAAREAAVLRCRAIAISQYVARGHEVQWNVTRYHAEPLLKMLLRQPPPPGYFWNANLPHPLDDKSEVEYAFCNLDTNPHEYNYRIEENNYIYEGAIHERPRNPGDDVDVCFGGKIAITRIALATQNLD
ncbi:MAG: 5'/3'-nucleotidase SurE [Desulfobacterales bacterium]|nr:MAG: 5'/3'-nucleotidase SurE [Desulfobacterales bacterium]